MWSVSQKTDTHLSHDFWVMVDLTVQVVFVLMNLYFSVSNWIPISQINRKKVKKKFHNSTYQIFLSVFCNFVHCSKITWVLSTWPLQSLICCQSTCRLWCWYLSGLVSLAFKVHFISFILCVSFHSNVYKWLLFFFKVYVAQEWLHVRNDSWILHPPPIYQ